MDRLADSQVIQQLLPAFTKKWEKKIMLIDIQKSKENPIGLLSFSVFIFGFEVQKWLIFLPFHSVYTVPQGLHHHALISPWP